MTETTRRPERFRIDGRVLFLTEDPDLVRRQLGGEDIAWPEGEGGPALRNDISTDEITPATICYYYDETLGDFPYLGLRCGGEAPVKRGAVRGGGFAVSVSGRRRGKGSSREQSPFAEMCAGIRLVIAENIERIYRENCQNLGMLTSTDFSLIARIRRGETLSLEDFTRGADPISRGIIEYGGLYPYNQARLAGRVAPPAVVTPARSMTLVEKILARHWIVDAVTDRVGVPAVQPGDAGFVRTDWRFSHEYVTPMASIFFERNVGAEARVADPGSVLFFEDHLTYLDQVIAEERRAAGLLEVARELARKQSVFAERQGVRLHGRLADGGGSEGICHAVMLDRYVLPGQVVVGSDSHTPHAGAIGCLAFGIGTTAVFNGWVTRDVRVMVPRTFLVRARGRLPAGCTAKDLMLEILRNDYVRSGKAIDQVIEYAGEAVEALSVDERATLTNMAAEVGAFAGIVAPDGKAVDFLVTRRGMARPDAERLLEGLHADSGADYRHVIEIDASALRPMVALPGDPGLGRCVDELDEVRIDIAYGGSCTGGKREDMAMYAEVLRAAVARGERVAEGVTFWIQFGSQEVRAHCEQKGYLDIFRRAGARIIEPSCGACINAGPGVSTREDQVTVSAINRNFPGRSGPGRMYLASPYTVAASAVAGRIVAWVPEVGLAGVGRA